MYHDSIASTQALVASRRRARWAAVTAHVLGAVVPGFLTFTTEGPAAGPDGAANVTHARIALGVTVVLAVAQAVALLVWRRRSRACHAAAGRVTGPRGYRYRNGRVLVKVSAWMLLAAPWLLEIGYLAQAFMSMGDGGYNQQSSQLTLGMIVLGVVLAAVGLICGGFGLLWVRTFEGTARDMMIITGGPAAPRAVPATGLAPAQPAPATDTGASTDTSASADTGARTDTGARIAALGRMRRRATVYIAVSVVLMAALVALAAVAMATGQWQLRYAVMIPPFFLVSLSRAAISVKARQATVRAIRSLAQQDGTHNGYGQQAVAPAGPAPAWDPRQLTVR